MRALLATRRRKATAVVASVALIAAAAALAAWIISGVGPTEAQVGTAQNLTVVPSSTPAPACYPGQTCLRGAAVTNPNDAAVTLTEVDYLAAPAPFTSDQTNCPFSGNFAVGSAVPISPPVVIPANTTQDVFLPGLTLSTAAPVACAGVTVTVETYVEGTLGS